MQGKNEDELCDFVALTEHKKLDIRFIEYMPFDGNRWNADKMVTYQDMLKCIRDRWPDFSRLQDPDHSTSKVIVENISGFFPFIWNFLSLLCAS